jgi:glycosyltransferase involved in cell wall biosynthesis
MASSPESPQSAQLAEQVAMLCQGDEVYGIGTIEKLYAQALPQIAFVALGDGPLVDWLRASGNRVDVVHGLARFHEGGSSLSTLLRSPAMLVRARRDAARIDALLRPRGIRIVHAHWRPQQIIAGFLRKRGYRSIWQINNNMSRGRLLGLGVTLNHRMASWGADLLLPASEYIARNWEGCGVRSMTIHNAAWPIFSQPNTLPEQPVQCLVAGRLEHSKGHHVAVEAVLRVRAEGFDLRLDVYGDPVFKNPYADALRRRIAAANCEDFIRLLGFQPDLRQLHQQYHLGLQCRIDPEPCSLWVCEAMVDGLPLVASATGGTPELVEGGVTGLLYRPGDVEELTEKILTLVRDPARLNEMRQQAFDRGQRLFTLDRFARQSLAAYESLIGDGRQ